MLGKLSDSTAAITAFCCAIGKLRVQLRSKFTILLSFTSNQENCYITQSGFPSTPAAIIKPLHEALSPVVRNIGSF
jgi:hypothetical protein